MNQTPAYEVVLALYDAITHALGAMAEVAQSEERREEFLDLQALNESLRAHVASTSWTPLRRIQIS